MNKNFKQQIDHIKTLMSWKAYLETVYNSIINRLKSNVNKNIISTTIKTFEKLFSEIFNKNFENFEFKRAYKTNRLSVFSNTEESITVGQQSYCYL